MSTLSAVARPSPAPVPAQRSPAPARLAVEARPDLDLAPQDAAAMDALLDSRPTVAVFLSRPWLSGFFAEPGGNVEPSLVLIREGAVLRGVAPLAIRRTRTHVRVALLGGGAGSDRTDLLAAPGLEGACADALVSWLRQSFGRRFVLALRDVPAESSLWGAVHRARAEGTPRLVLQPSDVHTLPFLDLAPDGPSAAAPFHPRSLDKHRRWLERRGGLRIERLDDVDEALRALDTLARMLHARWRGHHGGSALDDPRAVRFHRHVIPRLLKERRLRMIRLSAGAGPIAVFYGVAHGGWWGYCLAGYEREWAGRIHLGQITLAAAIDLAAAEGAREFDFLKGAHRTKYLWPVRDRATLDAWAYSEGCAPQLARAAWAARETAAALARSARGAFAR